VLRGPVPACGMIGQKGRSLAPAVLMPAESCGTKVGKANRTWWRSMAELWELMLRGSMIARSSEAAVSRLRKDEEDSGVTLRVLD